MLLHVVYFLGSDYQLPRHVAATFVKSGVKHNILDVGAGTGLLGVFLKHAGLTKIDGIDISPQMLSEAERKGCYRQLYEANLTLPLTLISDESYNGIVSSGTFTNGHLGPSVLDELLRIAQPNALFAFSVNANHWRSQKFSEALTKLAQKIKKFRIKNVRIYGDKATGPNKDDMCHIVQFLKS